MYKPDLDSLITAVHAVIRGRLYLSETPLDLLLRESLSTLGSSVRELPEDDLRVLQLIIGGSTDKEIAAKLHFTLKRIEWIKLRLRRQFGAGTTAQLAVRAVRQGISEAHRGGLARKEGRKEGRKLTETERVRR